MRIRIVKPGMLSTMQDGGRHLYLSHAVPVSGAMDILSARVANLVVGNDDNAAVIEFTYANAEFIAETDLLIAYSGDGATLTAANTDMPTERPLFIPSGTIMRFINNPLGSRTYLSVAGGWDVPEVLGSRSTYLTAALGGLQGRALQPGDLLNSASQLTPTSINILNSLKSSSVNYSNWSLAHPVLLSAEKKIIRVVKAKEFNWFDQTSLDSFFSERYTLSLRSNRMGYHLEGPVITRKVKDELLSTAVTPGTIQVTGNGNMVLLMADCQTTGGYPRIAQVAAVDLPLCGQLKPGDTIYFKEISRREAEMLYIERENQWHKMKVTLKNRFL